MTTIIVVMLILITITILIIIIVIMIMITITIMTMIMIMIIDDSLKNAERENRGKGSGSEFRNLQADHQDKQWRKFLCSTRNKQVLIVFVTKKLSGRRKSMLVTSKQITRTNNGENSYAVHGTSKY